ncbi:MAG: hypothetical protein JWM82_868, partial [Myxococcales bacterium]|nr:hypothetical protein [Myxococcales bacterium]
VEHDLTMGHRSSDGAVGPVAWRVELDSVGAILIMARLGFNIPE